MSEENNKQIDKELSDLLNNALQDFDDFNDQRDGANDAQSNENDKLGSEQKEEQTMEEFLTEQAKALTECMSTIFVDSEAASSSTNGILRPPQDKDRILDSFKKMADAAAMVLHGKSDANDDEVAKYSNIIGHTIKSLQKGQDNLEMSIAETDFNFDIDTDSNNGNVFIPFMEGMMQSLLSSEVILPIIRDLLEKYMKYLTENADKLSAEEKDRYNKQLELYKTMEDHLKEEDLNDTPKKKREKFKIILEDIRKLQDYGEAPQEVFSEIAGVLPLLDPAILGATKGGSKLPMSHDFLKKFFLNHLPFM